MLFFTDRPIGNSPLIHFFEHHYSAFICQISSVNLLFTIYLATACHSASV